MHLYDIKKNNGSLILGMCLLKMNNFYEMLSILISYVYLIIGNLLQ